MTTLDARIGTLNNGKFYAFANGYDQAEIMGTLAEVEAALGLRTVDAAATETSRFVIVLRFAHPAWDEVNGIVYSGVLARTKSEAVAIARNMARNDGHTVTGKGRYWFAAELEN